jgi:bifunctional DNA-binding transcriptional regulator/antitoxin component of YhaV-PrlF toxin-antitoxin module
VPTPTVTEKGRVTLRQDVLRHLGVRPGDKIDVDLSPHGRAILRRARPGEIEATFGLLAGRVDALVGVESMNAAIEAGWAGERSARCPVGGGP